jgi:hypothetical protein
MREASVQKSNPMRSTCRPAVKFDPPRKEPTRTEKMAGP